MVLLPMSINHWILMLGPNQGMGRRFVVSTHSNYPFCKKTSGRWDRQALETTLLTPLTIPFTRYGRIYYLLFKLLENCKQYEVTITNYLACNCMGFSSMMSTSLGGQGPWVQCKHLYYILQYHAMYLGISEPLIHYPSWS